MIIAGLRNVAANGARVAAILACVVIAAISAAAQDAKLATAKAEITERISKSGAEVAVYLTTLDGKLGWSFRDTETFHAASTMKVPVMIELFHQVKEGKIGLEDRIPITNQFRSIVDGSVYTLSAKDDSEVELYQAEGQTRSLRELCELMITASSNLATNLLIETVGVKNIRSTVYHLGADGMNVLRGVEDGKAFEKNLNNTTTARGLGILLRTIADGTAVDPESSHAMIAILQRQKFNEGIPYGLPPGIPVAHKTGEITKIHHDAAIVFAKRPYVLVILVRGLADKKDSAALMSEISKSLYQATQQ